MTDFSDLTTGMAAGAMIGYRMGSDLRDIIQERAAAKETNETIRQWEIYSENLKRQLAERNLQLANANSTIEILDDQIDEIKGLARDLASEIDDNRDLSRQQSVELEKLRASERKWKKLEEDHAKHRAFLERENAKLKHASTTNSAQAAAYEGLFRLLASEMARSKHIESFSVLNTEFIQKAYERAYAGFLRTGKINYRPDLNPTDVIRRYERLT